MSTSTMKYGMRKAPPPFWHAMNGNLHKFPKPTDMEMHTMRNSTEFPHRARSMTFSVLGEIWKGDFCNWANDRIGSYRWLGFEIFVVGFEGEVDCACCMGIAVLEKQRG